MKIILELALCIALAAFMYSVGFTAAKKKSKDVVIDVGKCGFNYIMSVPKGKTISIKNSSDDLIMVVPDLKSFHEEDE